MSRLGLERFSRAIDASSISAFDTIEQMRSFILKSNGVLPLFGPSDSLSALLAARYCSMHVTKKSPLLILTESEAVARSFAKDLQFFLGGGTRQATEDTDADTRVLLWPEDEGSLFWESSWDRKPTYRRMSILFQLSQQLQKLVVVSSVTSFMRKVIPKSEFLSLIDVVQAGQEIDREKLVALLAGSGYAKMPICEDAGTFAVHGGILDVFVPLYPFPMRIEFFGDSVESIRYYDPSTQRTLRAVDEMYIHPVSDRGRSRSPYIRDRMLEAADLIHYPSTKTRELIERLEQGEDFLGVEMYTPAFFPSMSSLMEYFPEETSIWLQHPERMGYEIARVMEEAANAYQRCVDENRLAFSPSEWLLPSTSIDDYATTRKCRQIHVHALVIEQGEHIQDQGPHATERQIAFSDHRPLADALRKARIQKQEHLLLPLAERLKEQLHEGTRVVITSPSLHRGERLESLLKAYEVPTKLYRKGIAGLIAASEGGEAIHSFDLLERQTNPVVEIRIGSVSEGFDLPFDRVSLYAEAEIFGERSSRGAVIPKKTTLGHTKDLVPGALVVHATHGIGRYQGLVQLPLQGISMDFVHLVYDGGTLYLPVFRLGEIKPYVGAEGAHPKLDKLGGETWQKAKQKVSVEVQKLAEELLAVYAKRQALPGTSHKLDTEQEQLFSEFESLFPYEETPDQQRAIDEVLADLDQEHPMDRLICGDVGYGKTEVALRAAMKVVLSGKQVAILAPTTVLVEQHMARCIERFSSVPVRVRALSRFRSKKEQLEVLKGLSDGNIDVVVGTHRLLSADVRFARLGLLIIDEEQRFGVAHKERLRTLKTQLDTLTLSATPIPRTLHMAFSGLREVSIISTPPEDRLAIRTMVVRENDSLIKEAIEKELRRGGQVFFVHNRVETISKWARRLHDLFKDVRIGIGHGQLDAEELEKVMLDFIEGRLDVLLCTTIIESGLDIPRANTMIIDRADTFGLSQLYQMRGRIGRSKERAFCYLMVPPHDKMTKEATERLAVLQRFTELGSGFAIASHDLEIRGAGELLGDKQSGTISAVGFDMYTQMLKEAVSVLQGQPVSTQKEPEFSSDLPGFIPDTYISDAGQRLRLYQRLSLASSESEVEQILSEMIDRYGPLPDEVGLLAQMMVVLLLGRRLSATSIELSESRLALALSPETTLSPERVLELLRTPRSPWKFTQDMRLARTLSAEEKPKRVTVARDALLSLIQRAE